MRSNKLFETLPYPTYNNEDIELKTNQIYEHLKSQYWGGGRSVYGGY
jgi:type I restriction enzyme R subunit